MGKGNKHNVYQFDWCVMGFDQRVNIAASTRTVAKRIFADKVIREKDKTYSPKLFKIGGAKPKVKTWAANFASVTNMNQIYVPAILNRIDIHYKEKDEKLK